MKKIWQTCKAYPIAIVFFVFLMGFSVLDALWPKRAHSELENRDPCPKARLFHCQRGKQAEPLDGAV